jgi:hypothetical protein
MGSLFALSSSSLLSSSILLIILHTFYMDSYCLQAPSFIRKCNAHFVAKEILAPSDDLGKEALLLTKQALDLKISSPFLPAFLWVHRCFQSPQGESETERAEGLAWLLETSEKYHELEVGKARKTQSHIDHKIQQLHTSSLEKSILDFQQHCISEVSLSSDTNYSDLGGSLIAFTEEVKGMKRVFSELAEASKRFVFYYEHRTGELKVLLEFLDSFAEYVTHVRLGCSKVIDRQPTLSPRSLVREMPLEELVQKANLTNFQSKTPLEYLASRDITTAKGLLEDEKIPGLWKVRLNAFLHSFPEEKTIDQVSPSSSHTHTHHLLACEVEHASPHSITSSFPSSTSSSISSSVSSSINSSSISSSTSPSTSSSTSSHSPSTSSSTSSHSPSTHPSADNSSLSESGDAMEIDSQTNQHLESPGEIEGIHFEHNNLD